MSFVYKIKSLIITLCLVISIVFASLNVSYAASSSNSGNNADDGISQALCYVLQKLLGPIGKGIATVAIIFMCFTLFLGKITWGVAIATSLGVAGVTASPYLVLVLSGQPVTGDANAALQQFCGK